MSAASRGPTRVCETGAARYAPPVSTPSRCSLAPFLLLLGCAGAADGATASVSDASASDVLGEVGPGDASSTADAPSGDSAALDAGPLPSAGCGAPFNSGVKVVSTTAAGLARTYLLSVPDGYDAKTPYPLVFGWHGRLGNGAQFRSYSGVEVASAKKAVFVYPDGLPITAVPTDTGWVLAEGGRDVAFFDALLREQLTRLCIDQRRVYAFGHSYGAYLSNVLGCRRREDLTAIAAFAGGPPAGTCDGPIPAWIAHASDDTVVLITEGQATRDKWADLAGCELTKSSAVSPSPCVTFAGCKADAPLHWCNPAFGNHNWPTFAGEGIWSFFASFAFAK